MRISAGRDVCWGDGGEQTSVSSGQLFACLQLSCVTFAFQLGELKWGRRVSRRK